MSEHEEFVCVERQRDEAIRERDEARKDRDGWRASEQETSRDYHELRDLNTKVRSILRAPLDTTTDDAAAGVVYERDRLYAEIQKLTAERKDILEQRDEARQQRDEAQKLAVERGEQIEGLKHNLERADAEAERVWSRWEALAGRLRSIDRVLLIETHDAEATLQAVQKVVNEHRKAVIDLDYQRTEACKADQRAARLAEELERTKTLLAEQQRREVEQQKNWDKFAGEVLEALSAGPMEGMVEAARRVAVERDKLREQWVEPRERAKCTPARSGARDRVPLDGAEAQALEHALTITERERDQAREQAAKLAEELERTKTLLAEDRAELAEAIAYRNEAIETRDRYHRLRAAMLPDTRAVLGATGEENAVDAARRVVAEREELRTRVRDVERELARRKERDRLEAEIAARPGSGLWEDVTFSAMMQQKAKASDGLAERDQARDQSSKLAEDRDWLQWTKEVRGALRARPTESTGEAIRRVIAERDEAVQHARDAKRALNPAELPPGLRWVWEGSDFDGSGRWEALYESLIVGRVERCSATGTTPSGWRWQRLDGTRDWGIEDDEYTGLVGLARHLREHPPLAAVAPAEPEPELPPGLSWRHLGAFKSQVLKGDRVVGEFVCVGTNRWSWWMVYPKSPSVLSAAGHEEMSGYEARAALVAALRKAHGSSEQADAPASTEQQPSESADPLGLPPGLHWAQDKAPHGEWFVDAAKGRPLAWAGQTDDGWGWHLSSIGVCYGSAPTVVEERGLPSVDEARKRLAAHLRQRGPSSKG